ncbi:MAG: cupredoxin family copper-binding protein [Candidatus Eremiobacteraeota bacterium]|nr:cupredoxin family copper-binding protein [Candidatus Eremiobacteraeota bacterium]
MALPASADSPSPAPTSTAKPAAVVHIAGFAYKPPTVTIAPGETVLFINDDDDAHTVTATDKTFDSGGMDSHDSWRKTFTKPGRYTYFCALHPYMKAVVVVASSQKGNTP